MRIVLGIVTVIVFVLSCSKQEELFIWDNPELPLEIPPGFPALNRFVQDNRPTKYGVQLGEKLFNETKLSGNNTISCASCHHPSKAFADANAQAIGIYNRVGLRNTTPIQNMAFMQFYNWDGNILQLEKQPLVPIITHEEMNSSILEVIGKLSEEAAYKALFKQAFGDDEITADRIYRSIAQYEYTLISADSKYDQVMRGDAIAFTEIESEGFAVFQQKCAGCHSGALFTDQSFRNIGFPINTDSREAGRARVTGIADDHMRFRVPSLRNIMQTAPYGSFGQFPDLKTLLDYLADGVLDAPNLDPVFKENNNRIPLTEAEKQAILAFLSTLTDTQFLQK
ncbi:cytochrome c peroxidase [Sphingobacterium oryzagri]|uniref:Cytochrome c peroxidase n=1 Tax=Sphingobacterium oryzagri TaxID=3025669 RepID=A0ABY7WCR4_9SPHI|nr:cytochrome c peroxidase [Sphingobacterium sp. KACC 22765]WDF67444.1 cytochrome c peroxidase [Sphingobacterium sp. KACC 22765]